MFRSYKLRKAVVFWNNCYLSPRQTSKIAIEAIFLPLVETFPDPGLSVGFDHKKPLRG